MADSKISALPAITTLDAADEFVVAASGVNNKITAADVAVSFGGSSGLYDAYVRLIDTKAQNTNGGTFTSGAWQTRDLNSETDDTAGICTLAANQFTLPAGVYRIDAVAPAFEVSVHQTRLFDITNTALLLTGTSEYAPGTNITSSHSFLKGRFTLAGSTTMEFQHRCASTKATTGFGVAANFGAELFSVVELFRET